MVKFKVKKNDAGYGVYIEKSNGKDGLFISFETEAQAIKFANENGFYQVPVKAAEAATADKVADKKSKK